jgi:hypothetical protein
MTEAIREMIDNGHHGVTVPNRERTAGAKIVLNIDDEEQVVGIYLHARPCSKITLAPEQKSAGRRSLPSCAQLPEMENLP